MGRNDEAGKNRPQVLAIRAGAWSLTQPPMLAILMDRLGCFLELGPEVVSWRLIMATLPVRRVNQPLRVAEAIPLPTIGLTQAKAKLGDLFERALKDGPQEITRNGTDAVVVVSKQEWMNKSGVVIVTEVPHNSKRSAADFWLNSPLLGSGIKLEPIKGELREG